MPSSPCPLPAKNSDSGLEGSKLAKPKLKKAALSKKTKIKLSWKRDSKANGYYIYRAASKKGKYKKVKTIQKNKTLKWTDSNVKAGKTYYYKIRSYVKVSAKTKASGYSNVLSVKFQIILRNIKLFCNFLDRKHYGFLSNFNICFHLYIHSFRL